MMLKLWNDLSPSPSPSIRANLYTHLYMAQLINKLCDISEKPEASKSIPIAIGMEFDVSDVLNSKITGSQIKMCIKGSRIREDEAYAELY
jgi:hypothetical protein